MDQVDRAGFAFAVVIEAEVVRENDLSTTDLLILIKFMPKRAHFASVRAKIGMTTTMAVSTLMLLSIAGSSCRRLLNGAEAMMACSLDV